jgi:hypothetical protein
VFKVESLWISTLSLGNEARCAGEEATVRSLFGAAGGAFLSGLGPLTAPGWAGVARHRTSEVIVGGACGTQGEFLAN